jgi:hypothetical protein
MTYEQIYGVELAKKLKQNKQGLNNPSGRHRLLIHDSGKEIEIRGNFDQYCFEVLKINPNCLRSRHKKGLKYKGWIYKEL